MRCYQYGGLRFPPAALGTCPVLIVMILTVDGPRGNLILKLRGKVIVGIVQNAFLSPREDRLQPCVYPHFIRKHASSHSGPPVEWTGQSFAPIIQDTFCSHKNRSTLFVSLPFWIFSPFHEYFCSTSGKLYVFIFFRLTQCHE